MGSFFNTPSNLSNQSAIKELEGKPYLKFKHYNPNQQVTYVPKPNLPMGNYPNPMMTNNPMMQNQPLQQMQPPYRVNNIQQAH